MKNTKLETVSSHLNSNQNLFYVIFWKERIVTAQHFKCIHPRKGNIFLFMLGQSFLRMWRHTFPRLSVHFTTNYKTCLGTGTSSRKPPLEKRTIWIQSVNIGFTTVTYQKKRVHAANVLSDYSPQNYDYVSH